MEGNSASRAPRAGGPVLHPPGCQQPEPGLGRDSPAALPGCSLPSCHPAGTAPPEISVPEVNTAPCQTASPCPGNGSTPRSSTVLQRDLVLPQGPAVAQDTAEGFPCVLLRFKQGKFTVQAFAWCKGTGCLHWGRIGAAVTFRAVFAGEGGERKAGQGRARQGRTTAFFARIVFS